MKKEISVLDNATEIMNQLNSGVLLTTKNQDKVNSMTISWGALTIIWGKPHFIVFVRGSRYTKKMLDESMEFTINIAQNNVDKKILNYCGSKSGRDCDKVKDLGLELIESDKVNAPAIKQLPLTLECKVVYKQLHDKNALLPIIKDNFYPQAEDSDFHIAYYGEIVSSYIIK